MPKETTVIVPATEREAHCVHRVLMPLKDWMGASPETRDVVLVNDSRTARGRERISRIAGELGIDMVHSNPDEPKNVGKAGAVKQGIARARKNGSDVAVTLDADLKGLEPGSVDRMVNALRSGGHHMVVMRTMEGRNEYSHSHSGQRALWVPALNPWFGRGEGRKKWDSMLQGFGLEDGLNHLIPKSAFPEHPLFRAEEPYRAGTGQLEDVLRTKSVIEGRRRKADRLWRRRKNRGKRRG